MKIISVIVAVRKHSVMISRWLKGMVGFDDRVLFCLVCKSRNRSER